MLTHRLRERARAATSAGEPRPHTRRARHAEVRTRSRPAHLRILTTVVAAALIGGVGVAAAAAGRGGAPPPLAPAVSRPEPPSVAPAGVAVRTDHTAVLQGLVEARAAAWAERDPAALTACFTGGSAALASDESLLARAEQAGHRYEGLGFTVVDVRVTAESQDRLALEATIETSSYAVRTDAPGGASVSERAATTADVRLTMLLTEAGWRISEVRPAAA